jgi:hypothetical protein
MEKPALHPKFPAHPKLKPFKCKLFHDHGSNFDSSTLTYRYLLVAICCGGFEAMDPAFASFYPVTTPTLHIIGKNDTIVTEEKSKTLIRRCDDYRVEMHDGGTFRLVGCPTHGVNAH